MTSLLEAPADTGTFRGYLAAFGRDHGRDTIMGQAAVAESVRALNEGRIAWALTDSHSEYASDVVASVTHASVDAHGVLVEARWMPTERAQSLRQMVKAGGQLGLSIDYLTNAERPDGQGGRFLDSITIVGGAVTPKPMNAAALITESKTGASPSVPIVDLYADVVAESARRDPERKREDAMLAAATWPPESWPRAMRLSMIRGLAEAKAAILPGDEGEAMLAARREQDNAYSNGLAAWMAAHR